MFLRIAALLFASLLIGSVHAASPADNFVKPVTSRVAISPSGKYVAVITAIGHDKKALAIAPFENGKIGKFKGTNLGEMLVSDVIFKTDDRLIVTVVQRQMEVRGARDRDNKAVTVDRTLVLAMNRDGSDIKVMTRQRNGRPGRVGPAAGPPACAARLAQIVLRRQPVQGRHRDG